MNTRIFFHFLPMIFASVFLWFPGTLVADVPTKIKLATLAPQGTIYHRVVQEMGEQWRRAEGEDARFIVYPGGTQGGEADVVRRMRIGQLNASLLSVVGLSEIDFSVTALQYMPLVFRSWEEFDYAGSRLRPILEQRLRDKGFIVLFWVEAGWVRFFSRYPAARPEDFKDQTIFSWAGDLEHVRLVDSLGYRQAVLETADIFPSLQTGLIDVVPVTPAYALATQIYTLAPYMLDMKWAPIVGALVITEKAWLGMSPSGREALEQAAAGAADKLRAVRSDLDTRAVEAMQKRGLKVQPLTPETEAKWQQLVEGAYPAIRGNSVPAEIFDDVLQLLADFRSSGNVQ